MSAHPAFPNHVDSGEAVELAVEVRDEDSAIVATPSANAAAVATYRAAGFEALEEASDLRRP
ncbi:hypothetical protein V1260_14655 [Brachybacterium sp. J144]|uniref:hypothetical protein n=1 Tax=Brachybacterium sp. J144 TaxID=3116487 RepID=UPI002E78E32E|nr:hypothetical protein [Brachybacterium sp. J144]MEE1652019.1 hypothetical protein [Brachybacterium sp. J144]